MKIRAGLKCWQVLIPALIGVVSPSAAQDNPDNLRKAAQNPVASLISVPIQENWNFGIGPYDRTQNVMNIQPVIPLSIGKDWNLITRWITPVVFQPNTSTSHEGYYGLGDLNPSFFLSPKVSKVIWGIGPTFILPTATNTANLGQGKWSVGPTVVVLVQPAKWTLGFLANNVWSVAGHQDRAAVNQLLFQYFVNYNMRKGWYITSQPTLTANWRADQDKWVLPFGGGLGRIMKVGQQPMNLNVQFYANAIHPPGQSAWKFVVQLAFLFPKKS
jgi:hypothetical protein